MSEPAGVFGKYVIRKASGQPLDPDACYFVLRLDTDPAARRAAEEYAKHVLNRTLAEDIVMCVRELEAPCTCRYVDEHCARHPMFSRVWKAGVAPPTARNPLLWAHGLVQTIGHRLGMLAGADLARELLPALDVALAAKSREGGIAAQEPKP